MAIATSALHALVDPDLQRALNQVTTPLEFRTFAAVLSLNLAGQYLISNKQLADQINIQPQNCVGVLRSLETKGLVKRAKSGNGRFAIQVLAVQTPALKFNTTLAQQRMNAHSPERLVGAFAQVGAVFDPKTGAICWTTSENASQSLTGSSENDSQSLRPPGGSENDSQSLSQTGEDHCEKPTHHTRVFPSEKHSYSTEEIPESSSGKHGGASTTIVRGAPGKAGGYKTLAEKPDKRGDMGLITMPAAKKRDLVMSTNKSDQKRKQRLIELSGGRLKAQYIKMRKAATGEHWWANGKHNPAFAKAAILCLEYQIKFEEWIQFCADSYPEFVKGIAFPTPNMLNSREMMERFILTDTSAKKREKRKETQAGFSYSQHRNYDRDWEDMCRAAGLELPAHERTEAVGMMVKSIKYEVERMPQTGKLIRTLEPHICLIASHTKPEQVKEWLQRDSAKFPWSETMASAKRLATDPDRMALWKPVLEINQAVFGDN